MKTIVRASIIYLLLVFIYKLFGDPSSEDFVRYYWINYYWTVSSIYFMLVFYNIRQFCIDSIHKKVINTISAYWLVVLLLRIYIFFNIEKYKEIIETTGVLTIGGAFIVSALIYLTSQSWLRKY